MKMKNHTLLARLPVLLLLCLLHMQCSGLGGGNGSGGFEIDGERCYPQSKYLKEVCLEVQQGNISRINTKNEDGKAPIHLAIEEIAGVKIVGLLLDKGAKVDEFDEYGNTAFFLVASGKTHGDDNLCKLLELLLKKGADENFQDEDGKTALMQIICRKSLSDSLYRMVNLLPNDTTDFLLKDKEGNHPLHWAYRLSDTSKRKKVVTRIFDVMIENAARYKNSKMKDPGFFENKEAKIPPVFEYCPTVGDFEMWRKKEIELSEKLN